MSTIPNLKNLKLDLTTIDKVELVLKNLPNLQKLNDKAITPDLFAEEDNESKNLEKKSEREKEDNITNNNNNIQYNNNNLINNDKIIIEKNEFEHNSFEQTENELPDSNIESEIPNYDVSYIII